MARMNVPPTIKYHDDPVGDAMFSFDIAMTNRETSRIKMSMPMIFKKVTLSV